MRNSKLTTILLYAGFGLAVLALFVVLKFPWPALAARLAWAVNGSGVAHLSYLQAEPSRFPPGVVLEGVAVARATDPDAPLFTAGRVRISPLWGSLLLGRPGVALHMESYGGEVLARVRADSLFSPHAFEAEIDLQGLDLARHPLLAEQAGASGVLSGRIDLAGPLTAQVTTASQGAASQGPAGLSANAALSLEGAALRYKSAFLAREDIHLGDGEARLALKDGALGLERLGLSGGDLQGSLTGAFQPGRGNKFLTGGRLTVDGSVLVEPTLVDARKLPDKALADRLRGRQALPIKWNGPVAPLVGMAGML